MSFDLKTGRCFANTLVFDTYRQNITRQTTFIAAEVVVVLSVVAGLSHLYGCHNIEKTRDLI